MRKLSKEQVLLLHTQLIEEFGGTDGVRDYNLLDFALGSLSENFVMEKRLMASLVKDNFMALGLTDDGAASG